jgi:carbamoyltransferase
MAAVLGIAAHYHDAAAALLIDGRVVAAIQEDRLSRVNHDPRLPLRAARACLAYASLDAGALDRVVYYEDPYEKLERILMHTLRHAPRALRFFPRALRSQLGHKLWVLDDLAEQLGVPRGKVEHAAHHESHAASAFFASGFDDAAVLTLDGVGEHTTTAIWHGRGETLRPLLTQALPDSLGLVYAGLTAWLGFHVNADEYKVMGLAAYGAPRFRAELERVLRIEADGSLCVDASYFDDFLDPELAYGKKLVALLGEPRSARKPWLIGASADDQRYADIAASLQALTEDAALALAQRALRETGCDRLCLAGGVAHNARMIGELARRSGASALFVQPAAGDAGGALGAAYLGALRAGDRIETGFASAALGLPCDPARAEQLAHAQGLVARRVSDPAAELADALAGDRVIGVMTGRSEWGPRALGQRSILAAPGSPATRDRINAAIKHREPFRPFAPAVLDTQLERCMEPTHPLLERFMTSVAAVRSEARAQLGAVTHVDGTARVQRVEAASDTLLARTLRELEQRTGLGACLNTSLNVAGEPIACDVLDGIDTLIAGKLDALLVEDLWIEGPKP